jgi:hypothetical protein
LAAAGILVGMTFRGECYRLPRKRRRSAARTPDTSGYWANGGYGGWVSGSATANAGGWGSGIGWGGTGNWGSPVAPAAETEEADDSTELEEEWSEEGSDDMSDNASVSNSEEGLVA